MRRLVAAFPPADLAAVFTGDQSPENNSGDKSPHSKSEIVLTMNPWIAKAVILAASVVMVAIRAPHGQRSRRVKVVKSGKGTGR